MSQRRYDLTDFEWSIIAPLLPNKPRGVPRADDRKVLNGIDWRLRTGSPWADIPDRYGPPTTCYNRFVRWRKLGVWDRIFEAVSAGYDGDLQMIDASSIRVHQHAANVKKGASRKPTPPLGTGLTQVDAAPAHHAVGLGLRTRLHQRREFRLLRGAQPRRGSRRLAVGQTGRTRGVEPVDPVPQRLPLHAAQPRRRSPAHPVVHRGDRQQTPRLTGVVRRPRRLAHPNRIPIPSQRDRRHSVPPCHMPVPHESRRNRPDNPYPRVSFNAGWYKVNAR
jgi:transposase